MYILWVWKAYNDIQLQYTDYFHCPANSLYSTKSHTLYPWKILLVCACWPGGGGSILCSNKASVLGLYFYKNIDFLLLPSPARDFHQCSNGNSVYCPSPSISLLFSEEGGWVSLQCSHPPSPLATAVAPSSSFAPCGRFSQNSPILEETLGEVVE